MEPALVVTPIGFQSHDGRSTIKGQVWSAPPPPGRGRAAVRGVVQIVHGMSEHIGRYDDFARFLAGRGYVVCGADHVGHGKSAASPAELGELPVGGKDVLVEDVHELRRTVAARYPRQTPYVVFGHSMGSYLVRVYLARHGEGVAAAVVCGTGQPAPALSKAGRALARFVAQAKGEAFRSALLERVFTGSFSSQIEGARTPHDWICTDPKVVDAYEADELCGARFSAGGYAALADLTAEAASRSCAAKAPRQLPVLFVSGALDPVGACGAGVRAAAEALRRAGVEDVEVRLYEGMRHEILNEPGHARVFAEIADWMEERLCDHATS